ncbi:hypothetical protein GCM10027521_14310 [Amycolatopsis cihanbeyliensis]
MTSVEAVAAASGGCWELYRDGEGRPVVKVELNNAGRTSAERSLILAEVKDLLQSAQRGELKPYADLKQITRNRLIYELRWEIGDQYIPARLWRLYFGWHGNRGPLRLGLKFGQKPRGAQGGLVQDAHIDEAGHRYRDWLARHPNR